MLKRYVTSTELKLPFRKDMLDRKLKTDTEMRPRLKVRQIVRLSRLGGIQNETTSTVRAEN